MTVLYWLLGIVGVILAGFLWLDSTLRNIFNKNYVRIGEDNLTIIPHGAPAYNFIRVLFIVYSGKIRGRNAVKNSVTDLLAGKGGNPKYKVVQSQFMHMTLVTTWDPENARAVFFARDTEMVKPDSFGQIQTRLTGDSILMANGEQWKVHKAALSPAFKWEHIQSVLPEFISIVNELSDHLRTRTQKGIEIFPWIQNATLDAIGRGGFGLDFGAMRDGPDRSEGIKNYEKLWAEFQNPIHFIESLDKLTGGYKKLDKMFGDFEKFIASVISTKREHIKEQQKSGNWVPVDILDYLLVSDNGLTDQQIARNMNTFFVAGHETTASALSNTLHFLAENPRYQIRARKEIFEVCGNNPPTYEQVKSMKFLNNCVKETLRLLPPAHVVLRRSARDQVVGSMFLSKGAHVAVHIYALHRDKALWGDDAEDYNPDRFLPENSKDRHHYAYMPFIIGPRQCIGNNFAMLEIRTFLAVLLQKFDFVPDPNSKEPYGEYLGTLLQPPKNCTIILEPVKNK